jgi:hypothetical protein
VEALVRRPTFTRWERLRELFTYDLETGRLERVDGRKVTERMSVDGKSVKSAEVAWYLGRGVPPGFAVRHVNGDKADLRLANLALDLRPVEPNLPPPRKQATKRVRPRVMGAGTMALAARLGWYGDRLWFQGWLEREKARWAHARGDGPPVEEPGEYKVSREPAATPWWKKTEEDDDDTLNDFDPIDPEL